MEAKFFLRRQSKLEPVIVLAVFDSRFPLRKFFYSTGLRLNKQDWQARKKSKYGLPKDTADNVYLRDHLNKLSRAVTDWGKTKIGITALDRDELRDYLKNLGKPVEDPTNDNEPKTMVALWREYLESIKDTIEWRTFNSYSNSFETAIISEGKNSKKKRKGVNFREFLKEKKWQDITPEQFTPTHYNFYHGYLKTNVKPNTAAKRLKHLKQFLSYLVEDIKIPVGVDLDKITYRETAGLKLALSEEELQAYIDAKDLPDHLVKVRDLAVLQCATGLRISDRQRVDKNIKGNKIIIEAQKTRAEMEIPITPEVEKILKKYDNRLPELSEQHYREGIKAIHQKLFPSQTVQVRDGNKYKDVFVWEEISSHDMVRTFITLSAERGMSINSIAKITGKSVATLLKNYLVESQKVADKEMKKAWGASPLKVVA